SFRQDDRGPRKDAVDYSTASIASASVPVASLWGCRRRHRSVERDRRRARTARWTLAWRRATGPAMSTELHSVLTQILARSIRFPRTGPRSLLRGVTPIDREGLAGDERRTLRAEPDDGARNLSRLPDAADRMGRYQHLL